MPIFDVFLNFLSLKKKETYYNVSFMLIWGVLNACSFH